MTDAHPSVLLLCGAFSSQYWRSVYGAAALLKVPAAGNIARNFRNASYRLKIDSSIVNNQPVDATETAKVLTEDPTLTEQLRAAYVRHLLAFALVLDEIERLRSEAKSRKGWVMDTYLLRRARIA